MKFHVVSCKKYSQRSVRAVDIGDKTFSELVRTIPAFECPICGPFSHVELEWTGYWVDHGAYESSDDAIAARRALIAANPDQFKAE